MVWPESSSAARKHFVEQNFWKHFVEQKEGRPFSANFLKKIPQAGEFNNLLGRQNSGDQFCLPGRVDLI
jgi:hypothetical protein